MAMWRRVLFALLAIGIIASLFILYRRASQEDAARVIVIGAVLPMTGDAGTFGQNAFRGAELAVEQAQRLDVFKGKEVRLVVEDSRGNAQDAANAARKLLDVDHAVAIIGDVTSAGTHAIIPLVTPRKVTLLSPAASDPALSNASPYFLRLWPSDVYEAEVIAAHIKTRGFKKIAVIYANTDYGVGMEKQFSKAISPLQPVATIPIDRESLDFRPTIQRIKNLTSDALFLVLYPEDARRLLQQAQEQGLSIPMLATATIEDPSIAELPNAGSITFASPLPPDESESRKVFSERYSMKYGAEPGVLSDIGYDSAMLLIQALQHEPLSQPDRIPAFIKSLHDYKGVSGKISIQPNGDIKKPYGLKGILDGKFTWLSDAEQ